MTEIKETRIGEVRMFAGKRKNNQGKPSCKICLKNIKEGEMCIVVHWIKSAPKSFHLPCAFKLITALSFTIRDALARS